VTDATSVNDDELGVTTKQIVSLHDYLC